MTAPFLHSPLLSTIPGLVHGFTRRTLPSGEVLDLGRGASPARWAWLATALGAPGAGVALAHQVHGERVCAVHGAGLAGRCDALLTDTRGLLLAIRTADCVPALVVGRDGQLAAIHAGWRGVAAGVVPAALAAMRAPWRAAVGPCISGAAYEVGEEVIAGIAAAGVPERIFARRAPGMRPHADLSAAVAWQLARGGVEEVDALSVCTFSDPNLHSYRRDGAGAGRLAAVVGWSC